MCPDWTLPRQTFESFIGQYLIDSSYRHIVLFGNKNGEPLPPLVLSTHRVYAPYRARDAQRE